MKSKLIKYLDLAVVYLVYGLIFYIPISISLVSILSVIAVALFFIKQALAPDLSRIRSNKTLFLLFLVFFIFMALSLFNSGPLIGISLKALFIKWGRFPLMLWMVLDTFRDSKRIIRAAYVFLFGSVLVGFSIFSQKFFGLEFLRHRSLDGGVITGPFGNQNDLASYLTCVIPIALSFSLWKWKRVSVKTGFLLIFAMLMIFSLLTLCRGGWVGLAAGFIFVIFALNSHRIREKTFWVLFPLSYVLCVPLITFLLSLFKTRPAINGVDVSIAVRFDNYHAAWRMIKDHPFFGIGLGTFMQHFGQYTNSQGASYAHNCFLQIWAESGLLSLLSFLLLVGYVFYGSLRSLLRMPVSLDFFLLTGFNAGLLGFLVASLFDTQFYSFQLSFLLYFVLGLTVAYRQKGTL